MRTKIMKTFSLFMAAIMLFTVANVVSGSSDASNAAVDTVSVETEAVELPAVFAKLTAEGAEVELDGKNPGTVSVSIVVNEAMELYNVEGMWSLNEADGTSFTLKSITSEILEFNEEEYNYADAESGHVSWNDDTFTSPAVAAAGSKLLTATYEIAADTAEGSYELVFSVIVITGTDAEPIEVPAELTAVVEVKHHTLMPQFGKNADCDTDGWHSYYKCNVCGKLYSDDAGENEITDLDAWKTGDGKIPAKGHTAGTAVTEKYEEPDCDTDGSYDSVVYCSVCNEELSRETVTVPANGHTAGDVKVENNVDPTCDADGSYDNVVYCTECNEELSRETVTVPATGHSYDDGVVTLPTCTDEGYTTYTCECGHSYTDNKVPATDHAWGEPTYSETDGDTHTANYVCANDTTHTKSETAEHDFENGDCVCGTAKPVSNITVVSKGVAEYNSTTDVGYSVSGNVVTVKYDLACKVGYWNETTGKYVAITAVANADGSYSFTAPDGVTEVLLVVKGDANGNGLIQNNDVTLTKLAYLGKRAATAEAQFAMDVNGNGLIQNNDVTQTKLAYLGKRLFTW